MNNAVQWYIQEKLRKLASDARSASVHLRQARTLRQVRDFSTVHADPTVSSLRHLVPELRQLNMARDDRAKELVLQHLKELKKAASSEDKAQFNKILTAYRTEEWPFLRGELAALLHLIERELRMLNAK